jgi:hypothetical protein
MLSVLLVLIAVMTSWSSIGMMTDKKMLLMPRLIVSTPHPEYAVLLQGGTYYTAAWHVRRQTTLYVALRQPICWGGRS